MLYPKAKKWQSLEIPALTLSGGTLTQFKNKVLEYRVWTHPHSVGESGDDSYQTFEDYDEALQFSEKTKGTEKPIAVVWDIKNFGFREVVIE